MDSIKDVWDSVRLNLLDRLGNPLVGAFCLAWSVWNFRLILVVVGGGDWKTKLDYIDKVLMKTAWDWVVHGYLVPLGVAAVWIFLLPVVFRKVLVFHRKQAATTARAVMIADNEQPISAEEATKLRAKFLDSTVAWDQERAQYLKQIDELSERIASMQSSSAQEPDSSAQDASPDMNQHSNSEEVEKIEQGSDALVELVANLSHQPWPHLLGKADLDQLPSAVAMKVRGHRFGRNEVLALLAMRNWDRVTPAALARKLKVEDFDAKVILDHLRTLDLMSKGPDGLTLNADGRILTAFFKRIYVRLSAERPSETLQDQN